MRGQQAPPTRAGDAGGQRSGIGGDDAEHAAGGKKLRCSLDCFARMIEMLEHVDQKDGVPAAVLFVTERFERLFADVEPELLEAVQRGALR